MITKHPYGFPNPEYLLENSVSSPTKPGPLATLGSEQLPNIYPFTQTLSPPYSQPNSQPVQHREFLYYLLYICLAIRWRFKSTNYT